MSRNISQGHILVQFTAEKIGEHSIDVKINGTKVVGSPFRYVRIYIKLKINMKFIN